MVHKFLGGIWLASETNLDGEPDRDAETDRSDRIQDYEDAIDSANDDARARNAKKRSQTRVTAPERTQPSAP